MLNNIELYFIAELNKEYLKKYEAICENNGFAFNLSWDYDYEKAKEFNKFLKRLK